MSPSQNNVLQVMRLQRKTTILKNYRSMKELGSNSTYALKNNLVTGLINDPAFKVMVVRINGISRYLQLNVT